MRALGSVMMLLFGFTAAAGAQELTWRKDIQPIIAAKCGGCHGSAQPEFSEWMVQREKNKSLAPRMDTEQIHQRQMPWIVKVNGPIRFRQPQLHLALPQQRHDFGELLAVEGTLELANHDRIKTPVDMGNRGKKLRRLRPVGPCDPAGYSGSHLVPCCCQLSNIFVTHAQDASTASRRINRDASPAITSSNNRS